MNNEIEELKKLQEENEKLLAELQNRRQELREKLRRDLDLFQVSEKVLPPDTAVKIKNERRSLEERLKALDNMIEIVEPEIKRQACYLKLFKED